MEEFPVRTVTLQTTDLLQIKWFLISENLQWCWFWFEFSLISDWWFYFLMFLPVCTWCSDMKEVINVRDGIISVRERRKTDEKLKTIRILIITIKRVSHLVSISTHRGMLGNRDFMNVEGWWRKGTFTVQKLVHILQNFILIISEKESFCFNFLTAELISESIMSEKTTRYFQDFSRIEKLQLIIPGTFSLLLFVSCN